MTREQIDAIVNTPLQADFPCHSQIVEHGVATTTQCVKRRRKESTQLACVLQTVEARAQQPHVVTHKRYRKDYQLCNCKYIKNCKEAIIIIPITIPLAYVTYNTLYLYYTNLQVNCMIISRYCQLL